MLFWPSFSVNAAELINGSMQYERKSTSTCVSYRAKCREPTRVEADKDDNMETSACTKALARVLLASILRALSATPKWLCVL